MGRLLSCCIVLLAVLSSSATATTFTVNPDGSGDFTTINDAVAAAVDGDVIELGDGVFTGDGNRVVFFLGKRITIRSQSGDPTACIVDCEHTGRGFVFVSNEDTLSVLRNVTVRGGFASGDFPMGAGGGVVCNPGSPLIDGCIFESCRAVWGAGIACDELASNPLIRNCTFHFNVADYGGALYAHEARPRMHRCTIVSNTADLAAGLCLDDDSHIELTKTIIAYSLRGEAVSFLDGSTVSVSCCDIYGNICGDWAGYISQFYGVDGNFSEAPLFCDLASRDYSLQESSPCAPSVIPGCGQVGAWPVACAPLELACCLNDQCSLLLPEDCLAAGGETVFELMSCDSNPCVPALLTVAPDGSGEYPTIQDAIIAARDGDTVELLNGTYQGEGNRDLDFLGKSITVRSASGDPEACVIDVQGDCHQAVCFRRGEGPDTILEAVTMANAYGYSGGAVRTRLADTCPTIRGCIIRDNTGVNSGTAVQCDGGGISLIDCRIENNNGEGSWGGAVAIMGSGTVLMRGCQFVGNSGQRGGAIGCWFAHAVIESCLFESNSASDLGGAVFFQEDGGADFTACTFLNNEASGKGGAIHHWGGDLHVSDCEFKGNTANKGAAINTYCAPATLSDCRFLGNSASFGGAVRCEYVGAVDVQRCTFRGNVTESGGGLLAYYHDDSIRVVDSAFIDNVATISGGGIYSGHSIVNVWRSTFVGNESPMGAGIHTAGGYAVLTVDHSLVTQNRMGMGIDVRDDTVSWISCCDLYGNEGGDWVGEIAFWLGLDGNIEADPLLCGSIHPDNPYMLQEDSPCAEGNHPECHQIGAYGVGCNDEISAAEGVARADRLILEVPTPSLLGAEIVYRVPSETAGKTIRLAIYDASGRVVRTLVDGAIRPGTYSVAFDGDPRGGGSLSSGIYFVKLQAADHRIIRRAVVLR